MRGLSPDQLNAFIEVTRLASFSRAAERLNLSPSAISLQIRGLETRLGVQLIERLGKTAHPTPAGRELLRHAEAILRQSELAVEAMQAFARSGMGTVRLGAGTAALAYLLPPVLRRLRRSHPKLGLAISTATTDRMVAQLHANEIDLGILMLPIDETGLAVTFLREDPLVAIFAAGTRKLPKEVTPEDFIHQVLITDNAGARLNQTVTAWVRAGGVEPTLRMELGSLDAIKNVVAAGIGVALLPVEAVGAKPTIGALTVRPVRPPLSRQLALVQRKDKPDNPALAAVREAVLTLRVSPRESRNRSPGRPG
jgi:DNA-binding transcriptional LysR family regulator